MTLQAIGACERDAGGRPGKSAAAAYNIFPTESRSHHAFYSAVRWPHEVLASSSARSAKQSFQQLQAGSAAKMALVKFGLPLTVRFSAAFACDDLQTLSRRTSKHR